MNYQTPSSLPTPTPNSITFPFQNTTPAFVLSLFDTGLAVIKGLYLHQIPTVGFDHNPQMPGLKNKWSQTILCPSPIESASALVEFLCEHARSFGCKPVLYPASDLYVFFVAQNQDVLQKYFLINLPEKKVTDLILSKDTQSQYAESCGAIIPRQMSLKFSDAKNEETVHNTQLRYPVIMKSLHTYLWNRIFHSKGFVIQNDSELNAYYQKVKDKELDVFLQEIIEGPPTNNYEVSHYITQSGQVWGPFIMRKLRQYPVDFGVGSAGESLHNDEITSLANKLVQEMKIKGFANTEFKWDPQTKKYIYIETNLRVWQQIDLCRICGLDLALIQYLDLTNQKIDLQNNYKAHLRWIDPFNDIYSFLYQWGNHKLDFKIWLKSWKNTVSWGVTSVMNYPIYFHTQLLFKNLVSIFKFSISQLKNRFNGRDLS